MAEIEWKQRIKEQEEDKEYLAWKQQQAQKKKQSDFEM